MKLRAWHLTPDTPRKPARPSPGDRVELRVGTEPVQAGQTVWANVETLGRDGSRTSEARRGHWLHNVATKSYWAVDLGRFEVGDRVSYRVFADGPSGAAEAASEHGFRVGPKLHVALLWHHHQPIYRDLDDPAVEGVLRQPWVRLHALRDYFGMAELLRRHPGVHLTVNLTPALLWQLDEYVLRGCTDRALELTLTPADKLTPAQREEIVRGFYDADAENQIKVHPRYGELYEMRERAQAFRVSDLADLQMWFSLAWFPPELREGEVELPGGKVVSVQRFVERGRDFTRADIEEVVATQLDVLGAVVPLHRELQEAGQIELSTTPFYHPILPLLIDSDDAVIDRPGTTLPRRFAYPEDAKAQVELASEDYRRRFGRSPRGMWPAEGAVSRAAIACFAQAGVEWLATDRGVLAQSGRWGYRVDDPDVLCRPYLARAKERSITLFFRDTALSDDIGFRCHQEPEPERAARELVTRIKERFARRVSSDGPRVLTLALDGENPWGNYTRDGRPFLHALYRALEDDAELETVTFSEVLTGSAARLIDAPVAGQQHEVFELATGSWADEMESSPGVDLGTWIGEREENRAWELLGRARDALRRAGKTPRTDPAAFEALFAAEGSDWFWWYGADQDSGHDEDFDALFRAHLRAAHRRAGLPVPLELHRAIVSAVVVWNPDLPAQELDWGARLAIRAHCPGRVEHSVDGGEWQSEALVAVGGVIAGVATYGAVLGPFTQGTRELRLRMRCDSPSCNHEEEPCAGRTHVLGLGTTSEPGAG